MRTALRAWAVSLTALLAACAGLSVVSAGRTGTSLLRLGIAAGVLSVFAAAVALVVTGRDERNWRRNLVWGGAVPLAVGLVSGALAGTAGGAVAGVLALLPWLAGVLAAVGLGRWLPTLRIAVRRRRPDSRPNPW